MLRSPGQARGGRQQGGGPRVESLWPGWRNKDALYRWESMGGSFLNARGRAASVDLSFLSFTGKLASKLHAHSVNDTHKLVKQPGSGAGCFQQPSRSPLAFSVPALWWRGLTAPLSQCDRFGYTPAPAEAKKVPVTKPVRSGE
eukprot:923967-Pelagomonas_calceolata.AAC.2